MGWFSGLYREIIVGSWNSPHGCHDGPRSGDQEGSR
jgi:hypothetical protein